MDNTAPNRLSITFGSNRLAFLQAEADRLDIAIADLLRRIVDQYREEQAARISAGLQQMSASFGRTTSCSH